MPRWLVTGAGGLLGAELASVLDAAGWPVTAAARPDLDVTDPVAVEAAVPGHDVVINAAAYTDVDGAEGDAPRAVAVNGTAAGHLAAACRAAGARLVHVSTDYVFSGDAARPYPEDAPTGPVNVYGRSKLAGERAVLEGLPDAGYVVRTAWLYGRHGRSFVGTMLRLAEEGGAVDVVDDAYGQPTWTRPLAARLVDLGLAALAGSARPQVYHCAAAGQASRYELARAVFALAGFDPARVRPTSSAHAARPARRPAYSVLGHERWAAAGLPPMEHWRDMLAQAMERWR